MNMNSYSQKTNATLIKCLSSMIRYEYERIDDLLRHTRMSMLFNGFQLISNQKYGQPLSVSCRCYSLDDISVVDAVVSFSRTSLGRLPSNTVSKLHWYDRMYRRQYRTEMESLFDEYFACIDRIRCEQMMIYVEEDIHIHN
jgi:hypothetical protein